MIEHRLIWDKTAIIRLYVLFLTTNRTNFILSHQIIKSWAADTHICSWIKSLEQSTRSSDGTHMRRFGRLSAIAYNLWQASRRCFHHVNSRVYSRDLPTRHIPIPRMWKDSMCAMHSRIYMVHIPSRRSSQHITSHKTGCFNWTNQTRTMTLKTKHHHPSSQRHKEMNISFSNRLLTRTFLMDMNAVMLSAGTPSPSTYISNSLKPSQ